MECRMEKKSYSGTKPLQTPVKQCLESNELVKYMSKLPVFLERPETTSQDKLLSVGVLDWGRLEKWHHCHNNRIPVKTIFPLVSQTDALLAPLRDESSARPSKVHNRSSACRMKHRSSLHSNGMPKSVEESVKEDREIKCNKKKNPKDRRCFSIPDNAQGCEKKDLKGKIFPKNGVLSLGLNPEAGLNMEADSNRRRKSEKNLHERNRNDHDGELGRKPQGETKTCKRTSTRKGVAVPKTQLDSMANSTKIDSQSVALLSDVDGSDCNKPSEKDTPTTSHLRRLLEPLLKPRANRSGNSVDGIRGQGVQIIKLGCKTVNVNEKKKLGSSMARAVLRVSVKNNQPLFTFAVNKETDIIAATQKKMGSSEEGECTSAYTFFSIKDHKRNSGWLNQRGRGQTHGIISNVVAQMRVSSSLPSGSIREFVLFSVELDQESTEKSGLQLKNELAAIIVKIPRWFHNEELEDHIKDQDISATVILQSGVHSMPQKGGPSSLIQRWRTGGSCDCGGWDMGCNLRILTNQHNFSNKNSTTSNSPPSSNRFELFFLGEQPEEHPFLSFKPIKEGIYSIVYNSSLSQLQAFSICMALAESRKMSEITLEHKSSCDEHNARVETVLFSDQNSMHNGNAVGRV